MTNFRPPTEQPKAPAARQHWSTDLACWRSYVTDLIYAAAQPERGGEAYAAQVRRRRLLDDDQMGRLAEMGRELGTELRRLHPDAADCLALAQLATGEHPSQGAEDGRRARLNTEIRCARWLPKPPKSDAQLAAAERDRRAGTTEDQRQAQAEAIAGAL